MTLSDSTHVTIRILAGCLAFVGALYVLTMVETKPKELNVNVRLHMAPTSK